MARPQLHGFRHQQRLIVKGVELQVDTKSDAAWVLLRRTSDQLPVVRAAKHDSGRRYHQGTNPDRTGFLAYSVQYRRGFTCGVDQDQDTYWAEYSSTAQAGSVRYWLGDQLV